ncbi:hypothetical protein [Desulfohalovibrio reitneri]|uniref:hypothetical protein n=1 Tax=Desulfohalovibrio reitneri TaxID=1307759 RepID=UPI000A6513F0|nr:hypothetical protein [Desulfohalovibrio reitneri]
MIPGETVHSPLPWDLPWWMSDHFVFFGVLYAVLGIIGVGMAAAFIRSLLQTRKDSGHH